MTSTAAGLAPVVVSMEIAAPPETVFRFFTDPARFARWMGGNADIDPRPGGAVEIRYPGGEVARGTVIELTPNSRFVFTWGIDGSPAIPAASTEVVVTVEPSVAGSTVKLVQTGHLSEEARMGTTGGWMHYVSTLAAGAADDTMEARLTPLLTEWGNAWAETNPEKRLLILNKIWAVDGRFRNPMASTNGREALNAHMANAQMHMQGVSIEPTTRFEHTHNFFRYAWKMTTADGMQMGSGMDVGEITPDGQIAWMVGFWDPMPGMTA